MIKDNNIRKLKKLMKKGFLGYPVATVAYYGPNDEKATKAAVPIPLLKFSKAITADRVGTLWPILARTAKKAVDKAWRKPNTHRLRLIPRRTIMAPPNRAPAIIAQMPKIFTIVPISVFVNPISR